MSPLELVGLLTVFAIIVLVFVLLYGLGCKVNNTNAAQDYLDSSIERLWKSHMSLVREVSSIGEDLELPYGYVTVKAGKLTKSERNAAGWDIHATEDVVIPPGVFAKVSTGVITQMEGCHALMFDKSGLAAKYWLTRRAGVIDMDYPDEWCVIMANEGRETFHIKKGQKLCNVIFIPDFNIEVAAEDDGEVVLIDEQRTGGFGSTGA